LARGHELQTAAKGMNLQDLSSGSLILCPGSQRLRRTRV
jgi:hypothetical protein